MILNYFRHRSLPDFSRRHCYNQRCRSGSVGTGSGYLSDPSLCQLHSELPTALIYPDNILIILTYISKDRIFSLVLSVAASQIIVYFFFNSQKFLIKILKRQSAHRTIVSDKLDKHRHILKSYK